MTEETRVVSSTGGEKGQKLARYDLIPVRALEQVATLYGIGAQKYEERNWEKGYPWSLSYAAMQRHANAHWGGEEIDPETGIPHMASVVFHALAQLDFMQDHREFDDRPSTARKSPGLKWLEDTYSWEQEESEKQAKYDLLLDEAREPRVWDSIIDVPVGVFVIGARKDAEFFWDGSNESDDYLRCRLIGESWFPWGYIGDGFDSYNGPFTEVTKEAA